MTSSPMPSSGRAGPTFDIVQPGVLPTAVLIDYFDRNGRDLPWRRPEVGPWGVLVSEVMLQQTPVSRVRPVFEEWLRRWPTPGALAADSPGDAVRAWGRLGYPRRALRLHAAATAICALPTGSVPPEVDDLLRLPGIGEYTARAVAAFAFGARTPVIDTNVRRVLSRVVRGQDSVREPATAADRRELAGLLPAEPAAAARFSVALMELGALICTAASPRCAQCPVQPNCRWRLAGFPAATARRQVQSWHGTDRQVRGKILAALRASPHPLSGPDLRPDGVTAEQYARCVDSLLADGLLVRTSEQRLGLPS